MLIWYIFLSSFFAYIAGACGEGMRNGAKKNLIILFFLMASWYVSIVIVGYVHRNPV